MNLPAKLLIALGKYYLRRHDGKLHQTGETWENGRVVRLEFQRGPVFDKDTYLEEIFHEAAYAKLSVEAVAGTFWFTRGRQTVEMSERTWPATLPTVRLARKKKKKDPGAELAAPVPVEG
jgi:hypothetical protein